MAGSFLYCMVIQYYYGYGDSFGFFQGSNFIRKILGASGNPFTTFFMSSADFAKLVSVITDPDINLPTGIDISSNLTIMKIAAVLSYFSFNSYLIISLFFGLFSFIGLWKLFTTLNEIMGKKGERLLAIAVLYIPSIWFWGGGLIKDSICVGSIGLILYYIHKIFIKKKFKIRDVLMLFLVFYLLFLIKSYLASTLLASMVLAYILFILIQSKKNVLKLGLVSLLVLIGSIIIIASFSSTLDSIIEDSKSNIETFSRAYANATVEDERSRASFTGAALDNSIPGILMASPIAIFTTLFRPFLWETQKPIMLFSALESFLSLLATLFVLVKCRVWRFFYFIFSDPYLFFCFVFTMALAVIIGFSTFNFGTLVRYRLPILPFYFFMLLHIYIKNKEFHFQKINKAG